MKYLSLCMSLSTYMSLLLLHILIYGNVSSIDVVSYSFFLLISIFFLRYVGVSKYIKTVTSIVFSLMLLVFTVLIYTYAQGGVIDTYLIQSGLQTNPSELVEYVGGSVLLIFSIVFVILVMLINKALISYGFKKDLIGASFLVIILILILNQKPVAYIIRVISDYYHEFSEYQRFKQRRNVTDYLRDDTKIIRGDDSYIVIIGESLSKNHMSLYGYGLDTTPNFDSLYLNGQIMKHPNAISSHTFSQTVLKRALTSANQRNGKEFWQSASIMEALSKKGFHTSWISNQTAYGPWDSLITILAEEADVEVRLNKFAGRRVESKDFDEAILPYLEEALAIKGSKVIFVHLIGNHANYCSRYPESFGEYSDLNYIRSENFIACYDNSVKYNDYVVSKIFQLGMNNSNIKGTIYMPDHAEDILSGNKHNAAFFTSPMTEIPMLFQFSSDYLLTNHVKISNLKRNFDHFFVNDFLYDTVLGMVGIEDGKDSKGDLFSSSYSAEGLMTTGRKVSVNNSYLKKVNENILN